MAFKSFFNSICDNINGSKLIDNLKETRAKVKGRKINSTSELGQNAEPIDFGKMKGKNNNRTQYGGNLKNNNGLLRSDNPKTDALYTSIDDAGIKEPDENVLKKLLKSVKEGILDGKWFRTFKNLDARKYADVVYQLIANVKNGGIVAQNQIEKQLGHMYNGLDGTELNQLSKIIITQSQLDNIEHNLNIPFQKNTLENYKNLIGELAYENELENQMGEKLEEKERNLMIEIVTQSNLELQQFLEDNPHMQEYIEKRKQMFKDLQNKLIERYVQVYGDVDDNGDLLDTPRNQRIHDDISEIFGFENYYRNMVIDDVQRTLENLTNNVGKEFDSNVFNKAIARYIKRMGTNKDILTNFLYVDTLSLAHLQEQIYRLDYVETIKRKHDKTKDIIKPFRAEVEQKVGLIKDAYRDGNFNGLTNEQFREIENQLNIVIKKIVDNQYIDDNLKNLVINKTGIENINGKDMDIFDRIDYVLNTTMGFYEQQFANGTSQETLVSFYQSYPQHKGAVNFLLGNRDNISRGAMISFFRQYAHPKSQFANKAAAELILTFVDMKRNFNRGMERTVDVNITNYIDETKVTFLNRYGSPLNYNRGNNEIQEIKIGRLVDITYSNPSELASAVFDQFMASYQSGYLENMIEDGEVMIVDNDLGEGIINALEIPPRSKGVIRWFNKVGRAWMLMSPERVAKFMTMTSILSDGYRFISANPKGMLKIPKAFTMMMDYYKHGKLPDVTSNGKRTYTIEEQNLMNEFLKLFGGEFSYNAEDIEMKINSKAYKQLEEALNSYDGKKLNFIQKNKILRGYIDLVGDISNRREMIMRLAYALDVMDSVNNGTDINYGGAKRKFVDQVYDTKTGKGNKYAFMSQVANQNFVSYQEASYLAKGLNRTWMPFFLFKEGNIKWHYRLYQNYMSDVFSKTTSLNTKLKATGKATLSTALTMGLAQALWNQAMRAIDPDLPDDEQIPEYMKGITSNLFSDFSTETFGANLQQNYLLIPGIGKQYAIADKFTLSQDAFNLIPFMNGGLKEYAQMLISSVNPVIKSPVEWAYGADFYADGSMVPVRDDLSQIGNAGRKVSQFFGMDKTYQHLHDTITNTPNRDGNLLEDIWSYTWNQLPDEGMLNYNSSLAMIYDYMDSIGKTYQPSPGYAKEEERIRFSIKEGFKAGDLNYVDNAIMEYVKWLQDDGIDNDTIKQKIRGLIRSMDITRAGTLSNEERQQMVLDMSETQMQMFLSAIQFQNKMLAHYTALL